MRRSWEGELYRIGEIRVHQSSLFATSELTWLAFCFRLNSYTPVYPELIYVIAIISGVDTTSETVRRPEVPVTREALVVKLGKMSGSG